MKRRVVKVWYLNHAESESVLKVYSLKTAMRCCEVDGCDMISRKTYLRLRKEYGQADI
mgnify:CR=1 FL=1